MNRLSRTHRTIATVLGLTMVAAACGDSSDSSLSSVLNLDGPAATFDDQEFSLDQLDDLLPDGANTVPSRIASVVSRWLTTQAIEAELAERGFPVEQADVDQATDAVAGARGNDTQVELEIEFSALSYALDRWTDAELEDADDPELPGLLCSNHLLVETEDEADAALIRFEEGEEFAELAIELSTGPSGPTGGDLGCEREGFFVAEYEAAAYAASAGDVVGPVETQFGWHLIQVESVGPATAENHPDAPPADLEAIAAEAATIQRLELAGELERQAEANFRDLATVDPAIGTLPEDTLTVQPPE